MHIVYGTLTADAFELVFRRRFLGRDSVWDASVAVRAVSLVVTFGWGGRIAADSDDLFDCFFLQERGLGPRALDGGRLLAAPILLISTKGMVRVVERWRFISCRTSCTSSSSFSATAFLTLLVLPVLLLLPVPLADAGPWNVELVVHLVRSCCTLVRVADLLGCSSNKTVPRANRISGTYSILDDGKDDIDRSRCSNSSSCDAQK
jgi:hypothetical protein